MEQTIEVTGLHVYPIKSCGSIALDQAKIVRTGFELDRTWVLIDQQGEIITQRKKSAHKLALVQPFLQEDGVLVQAQGLTERLFLPYEYRAEGLLHEVSVWGNKCMGREESSEASAWFSRFLGFDVRLLRFEQGFDRIVNPAEVGNDLSRAEFQDGYPILIIAEESLEALNRSLIERGAPTVKMSRFRPNIVVRGMGEFGEDASIGIEGISTLLSFSFPKRCSRCVLINVDQDVGDTPQIPREQHPLTVLSETRMFEERGGKMKPGFGQNAIIDSVEKLPLRIRVGDRFVRKVAR